MKFRAVHIRTNPGEEREERSRQDVQGLMEYGIEYCAEYSAVCTEKPPQPREALDRPFLLTPRHYGCYKAHKDAILRYLDTSIDALLMFECDAVWAVSPLEMHQKIERAWWACQEGALDVFTFGPKHDGRTVDRVGDDVIVISQFIETHAYMIPLKSLSLFRETFAKPWDAVDFVYTVYLYDQGNKRIGAFRDRPVVVQANGVSLIDGVEKKSEDHWRYKSYA